MADEKEGTFQNPEAEEGQLTPSGAEEPQSESSTATEDTEQSREERQRQAAEDDRRSIRDQSRRMDSFQRKQKENTEKAREELDDDSAAARMSPEYSPPNTVRGTEGDNANYRPNRRSAVNPNEEWDPHGGEDEETGDNYEPAPIPE